MIDPLLGRSADFPNLNLRLITPRAGDTAFLPVLYIYRSFPIFKSMPIISLNFFIFYRKVYLNILDSLLYRYTSLPTPSSPTPPHTTPYHLLPYQPPPLPISSFHCFPQLNHPANINEHRIGFHPSNYSRKLHPPILVLQIPAPKLPL